MDNDIEAALESEGKILKPLSNILRSTEYRDNIFHKRLETEGSNTKAGSKQKIYYIEALTGKHKVSIHTANQILATSCSLSELSAKLGEDFILCHKSCLVNSNYIKKLKQESRELLLDNGETLRCSVRAWSRLIKDFSR